VCQWDTGASIVIVLLRAPSVKGTVSRDGYFLKAQISTSYVCADGFQSLSKAFHYRIQLLTFLLLP
jgi:hypothetical protein